MSNWDDPFGNGGTFGVIDVASIPDERISKLNEMVSKYYSDTENLDNYEAAKYSKALRAWVRNSGYTGDEFSRAKRNAELRNNQ